MDTKWQFYSGKETKNSSTSTPLQLDLVAGSIFTFKGFVSLHVHYLNILFHLSISSKLVNSGLQDFPGKPKAIIKKTKDIGFAQHPIAHVAQNEINGWEQNSQVKFLLPGCNYNYA